MANPYGENDQPSQLSHWIDRAVQAEFRAEKFETALSKEVLAVISKAAGESQAEVARLKAEVERLRNLGIKLESMIDPLEGRIERLTKAGDAMASELTEGFIGKLLIKEWEAAKEGKSQR